MIKVTETPSKTTAAKKNISLQNISVDSLHFEDESGDITEQVLSEIPRGVDTVNFKITIEYDDDYEELDF